MKNILLSALILLGASSCSKKDSGNKPTETDSISIVHDIIIGDWDYYRLDEKSIEVCAPKPCTLLNPDGTIKDTIRITYNLTDSYWSFSNNALTVFENRNNNGFGYQDRAYTLTYAGRSLQVNAIGLYNFVKITDSIMILDRYSRTAGINHYTEYYKRHYLRRK